MRANRTPHEATQVVVKEMQSLLEQGYSPEAASMKVQLTTCADAHKVLALYRDYINRPVSA